jgi:hypothetical protein
MQARERKGRRASAVSVGTHANPVQRPTSGSSTLTINSLPLEAVDLAGPREPRRPRVQAREVDEWKTLRLHLTSGRPCDST